MRILLLITLAIILISSSIIGLMTYQNHVNQIAVNIWKTVNVHNATVSPNPTASAIAMNPYPSYLDGNGRLVLYDPLSRSAQWSDYSAPPFGGTCKFINGAYHVSQAKIGNLFPCIASGTDFSDFALEVQMNVLEGDCGGIVFRSGLNGSLYHFRICQDGYFNLSLYMDSFGSKTRDLLNGLSPAIKRGLNQSNTLAIVADGSLLSLYVNHQELGNVDDGTCTHGSIGLVASTMDNPTEVAYSNIRVWRLLRA